MVPLSLNDPILSQGMRLGARNIIFWDQGPYRSPWGHQQGALYRIPLALEWGLQNPQLSLKRGEEHI